MLKHSFHFLIKFVNPYGAGIESESESESDVYRRQIMTTKVDPNTVRVKIVILIVDP